MNIHESIEKLLQFAQSHLMLDDLDVLWARNCILDELKLTDFVQYEIDVDQIEKLDNIDSVLDPIIEYAVTTGTCKVKDKPVLASNLLYFLSHRPSELVAMYGEQKAINSKKALDWLADYLQKSGFIAYPVLADSIEELAKLKLKIPKERTIATQSISFIEDILGYAEAHLLLDERDIPAARTRLMSEFKITETNEHFVDFEIIDELGMAGQILEPAVDYAIANKLIKIGQEDYFADKIMGLLTKRPSQIFDMFTALHAKNPVKAFDWAYDYAIKSNYVRYDKVLANRHWEAKNTTGKLEVTINTARGEKSDADIAKALTAKSTSYPKCDICKENEGAPSRKTLRTIPLSLNKNEWFWQFSPFSYFNQHGSLVSAEHTPMKIDREAFVTMLEFCDFVPSHFMGANAALPRVGGSILAHDHYQGGRSSMPMFKAPVLNTLKSSKHPYMKIEILDWYLPVVRLSYTNKGILADYASLIADAWGNYNDDDINLQAKTGVEQHSAVAVAARKGQNGFYTLDLILRNNRTDKKHPDGIFTALGSNRAIKSEAVGIVESLGHFILPGRLENQIAKISKYLTKESRYAETRLDDDLKVFAPIIEKLLKEAGSGRLGAFEAGLNIKTEINKICEQILVDCAVFKPTDEGRLGFYKFLSSIDVLPIPAK